VRRCLDAHAEVDELLRCRPDLGNLVRDAAAFRARLSQEHDPGVPGISALTAAGLRLLPMLASHLSFPQIAAQLFLSRHTVKSEAISTYRKLRVPPAPRRPVPRPGAPAGMTDGLSSRQGDEARPRHEVE
jgi:DNA-binding CsgD family transcriptional regulator